MRGSIAVESEQSKEHEPKNGLQKCSIDNSFANEGGIFRW